jgi:WD40 repeat protein
MDSAPLAGGVQGVSRWRPRFDGGLGKRQADVSVRQWGQRPPAEQVATETAVLAPDGEAPLFDVASRWQVATLSGLGGPVRWLGFHPDARSLVAAGTPTDKAVCVWDLATRKRPRRLRGHGSEVLSGAWRADGRLLITAGSTDGTVRRWDTSGDVPCSKALAVIPPAVPWLHSIALSPEGRHLAACNPNGTVYVLRLAKPGEVFQAPAEGQK